MMVRVAILLAVLVSAVSGCTESPQGDAQDVETSTQQSSLALQEEQLTYRYHWRRLKAEFLSNDGRVVDIGSEYSISTSEGQAYGMFFAVVANDSEAFDIMFQWADRNLTEQGIDAQLPAWLWGEDPDTGAWRVLDTNPATDADVWMAYALLEGGRLWQNPRYTAMGKLLAERILSEVTVYIDDELVLLPAPEGFVKDSFIRLNPSYASLSVFRGLATLHDAERWNLIYDSSVRLLELNSHHQNGLFSNWVNVTNDFSLAETNKLLGSYDAIRTYLWLSLEYQSGSKRVQDLVAASTPLVKFISEHQVPPEFTHEAHLEGTGSVGFSVVLAPYLSLFDEKLSTMQYQRLLARGADGYSNRYYDTMLILFGLGAEQCFKFDGHGLLEVNWDAAYC